MVRHFYLYTDSDEQKAADIEGTLANFAAYKLSCKMNDELNIPVDKIISIESFEFNTKVKPRMDNSDTWYDKDCIRLSVWYHTL